MNTLSELIDMLFDGYRTQGDDGTHAPVGFDFASRHNRDPSPDGSQDTDGSDNNDNDNDMSVGNQPKSSLFSHQVSSKQEHSGLERFTVAIRRISMNANQTLMLFPMPASHHLLVSKLLPILVTWTLVP